ncbi:MAG: 2-(1,2-epoxy-1,2-dihydrophenyl)acetyl-CoA isomerase [Polaribacter sp.]|jgi:2-(1,2-epoxy-1,2-dihydrophenyl)acetyl-CoA isomerase
MSALQFEIENGVAYFTLNRPDKYNSCNQEMALAIQERLKECETNPEVRCIYITGTGKAFCAGQDLQEVIDEDNGLEIESIVAEHYNPIVLKIRNIEKPVVAAVNGVAAGAGANLALCCDIVVATESASFIQAFSKIGLIPDTGGTYYLPRLIGMQKATALMMLGDKVSAEDAEKLGMIYKVFPNDKFVAESKALAAKLAAMPTRGLGLTKRALNYSTHNDLETQLGIEEQLQTAAAHTEDYNEGVGAFLEKRKPNFKGA